MTIETGKFVWFDLMTTNMDLAVGFYTKLFGWDVEVMNMGPMNYNMFKTNNNGLGGAMDVPNPGMPSQWVAYISCANIENTLKKIKESGGTVHSEINDIPNIGKFAFASDPQGASFAPFQPASMDNMASYKGEGTICWQELMTTEPEKAWSFYASVFGWNDGGKSTTTMGPYQLFNVGETQTGGIMKNPMPTPNASWMQYVHVNNVDEAFQKAQSLGANVLYPPMQIETAGGRIAGIIDPSGAKIALWQPATNN